MGRSLRGGPAWCECAIGQAGRAPVCGASTPPLLSPSPPPPLPPGRLRSLSLGLPHLEDLQLNNCAELAHLVLHCPALGRLALQGCRALPAAALLAVVASCPRLRELDLQYCPVGGSGVGGQWRGCILKTWCAQHARMLQSSLVTLSCHRGHRFACSP